MLLYTYVDYILILYDERKITEESILSEIKQLHRNLEIKLTLQKKRTVLIS
jgi:GTPase SAR1 family protein